MANVEGCIFPEYFLFDELESYNGPRDFGEFACPSSCGEGAFNAVEEGKGGMTLFQCLDCHFEGKVG